MTFSAKLVISVVLGFVAFAAEASDATGVWTAIIPTAIGPRDYTYVFQQDGTKLTGTAKSQDGEVPILNGSVTDGGVSFREYIMVQGEPLRLQYTGELVSDTEIRFKRQALGTTLPAVQFVATRVSTR